MGALLGSMGTGAAASQTMAPAASSALPAVGQSAVIGLEETLGRAAAMNQSRGAGDFMNGLLKKPLNQNQTNMLNMLQTSTPENQNQLQQWMGWM